MTPSTPPPIVNPSAPPVASIPPHSAVPESLATAMKPVKGRIAALDVARGIAILGILFANIPSLGGPFIERMIDPTYRLSPGDSLAQAFLNTFGTGKFRSMLAALFGMGLWIQFVRRQSEPGAWPGGYRRRLVVLMFLGMAHGVLIWYGDILFTYALIALVATAIVTSEDRSLKTIVGVITAIGAGIGVLVVAMAAIMHFVPMGASERPEIPFWPLRPGDELYAFQQGSWTLQLGMRALIWAVAGPSTAVTFGIFLLGIFLFGVLLQRIDFMRDPFGHPKVLRGMLAVGAGALVLNATALLFVNSPGQATYSYAIEFIFGPLLAVGYLALIAIWVAKGWARPIQTLFANVGRVALSVYIAQSIVCSIIFYSWGFGLFGKLGLTQMLGVAAMVNLGLIIAANVYLRYYRIGPVEWLWRSLSERRKLPIKGPATAEASG